MIKLEIDEKFEELSNLYDLFENITRIDYVPLEYREEIKKSLIKAYKDGNQEFEKIHEKLKRLEQLEKENQELKQDVKDVLEDYKDAATIMFKLDKAIEIIKNKCVSNTNLWLVVCSRNYEDYKSFVENKDHELVRIEHNILTQQEYELLKEVFGNE